MTLQSVPLKKDIIQAHERIKPYVYRTPILSSTSINQITGCEIFFKCENLQEVGAFKARGAINAVLCLLPEQREKGIATHSSGNHAQAIARAAKLMGIKSYIVMPTTAPSIKRKGVERYDGEIYECEPTIQAREQMLIEVVKKTGAAEIHPFNNYDVIAGQATAAKELYEDVINLNFCVAPVGGGGLLSGTALSTKFFSPETEVIAAEPDGANDAYRSLQSGKIEPSQAGSIADGLLTSLGDKTFAIIYENVKEIITVSDLEIISAMRLIWEQLKVIVEPSGAVSLAAVIKAKEKFAGTRVGIILSGGNVDFEKTLKLFTE
jgi:threonine dehydratase